ncbi:MAG: hypothetical protein KatS3mg035_2012 [Bacteroidia bacterium]|nr:MAG: hypothetical protein KatS3mg035_2012 [Bacteroidia bacterium]
MLFLIGIFSSLSVRSHHIYGSRIDYSFIGTRTQNGQQQIQYQIRVIINTDGSNLNGPNNKSLILRYTDLSNGQSANLSLTYQSFK